MEEDNVGDDGWLCCLGWSCTKSIEAVRICQWRTKFRDGTTYTQAPMKLLYEFALARQMLLPKQINVEAMRTGRLPKHVCMGTQMKLLKPSTRIATPVN